MCVLLCLLVAAICLMMVNINGAIAMFIVEAVIGFYFLFIRDRHAFVKTMPERPLSQRVLIYVIVTANALFTMYYMYTLYK